MKVLTHGFRSESEVNTPLMNRLLTALFRFDVATAPRLSPPFGVSILALVRKPATAPADGEADAGPCLVTLHGDRGGGDGPPRCWARRWPRSFRRRRLVFRAAAAAATESPLEALGAAELHARSIVIDTHADTTQRIVYRARISSTGSRARTSTSRR